MLKKKQKGFSLVELTVVLVIVGVLLLLSFNYFTAKNSSAKYNQLGLNDIRISEGYSNYILSNYNSYYQYLGQHPSATITVPIDLVINQAGFIDTKQFPNFVAGDPNTYVNKQGDVPCAIISYNTLTDNLEGFVYFTLKTDAEQTIHQKKDYLSIDQLQNSIGGLGINLGYYFYDPLDLSKNKLTSFNGTWGLLKSSMVSTVTSLTSPDGRNIAGVCRSEIRPRSFVVNISSELKVENVTSTSNFFKSVSDNNKTTTNNSNNNIVSTTSGALKLTNNSQNFLLSFLNKDTSLSSFSGVWGDTINGYSGFFSNDFNRQLTKTGTNAYTSITSPYLQTTNANVQLSAGVGTGCNAGDLSMTKQGIVHQYSSTTNIDEQILVLCNNSNQYKVTYPVNESSMNAYGILE